VRALARNRLDDPYLLAFAWLYAVALGYESGPGSWQPITLEVGFGVAALHVGFNFVGAVLLGWYRSNGVRAQRIVPVSAAPAETSCAGRPDPARAVEDGSGLRTVNPSGLT
jgi:hypothetical protein